MDWTERINRALDYIENNLDADIDLNYAAKLAFCSLNNFSSVFAIITGVQLNEYIRKRRLSLAALELQNSSGKIIDISLKYGYSSPTAFTRAFQKQHKVSPQYARVRRIFLTVYPKITFQIKVKGDIKMKCKIEKKEAFTIIGIKKSFIYDNNDIKSFWNGTPQNIYDRLTAIKNTEPKGILGVVANFRDTDFDYYIAVATTEDILSANLEKLEVPSATWAIFENNGTIPETIDIFREWLPSSGYMRAEYDIPDIEVYHNSDGRLLNDTLEYELWFPVVKE